MKTLTLGDQVRAVVANERPEAVIEVLCVVLAEHIADLSPSLVDAGYSVDTLAGNIKGYIRRRMLKPYT